MGREEREGRWAVSLERTLEACQSPGDASDRGARGSPRRAAHGRYIQARRALPCLLGQAHSSRFPGSSCIGLPSPDTETPHCPLASGLFSCSFRMFRPGLPGALQHLHASPHGILTAWGWASFAHFTDQETEAQSCSGSRLHIIQNARCCIFPPLLPRLGLCRVCRGLARLAFGKPLVIECG